VPFLALLLLTAVASGQDLVWRYAFSPSQGGNSAVAAAASPGGAVVVAGVSNNNADGAPDMLTVKLDAATGDTFWRRRWNGGTDITDSTRALAVDADGNVFVAGVTRPRFLAQIPDIAVLKYSPAGTLEWSRIYNYGAFDRPDALLPDGRGGVFVTGTSQTDPAHYYTRDVVTIHYDAAGDTLWTARFDGPAANMDFGFGLGLASDRALYVCGHVYALGDTTLDIAVLKYDSLGNLLWSRRHWGGVQNAAYPDASYRLAVDSIDNVYVVGKTRELMTSYDLTTVKFSPDGTKLWATAFDNGLGTDDQGYRVAIGPGGSVYVAGSGYFDTYSELPGYQVLRLDGTTGVIEDTFMYGPRFPDGSDGDTLCDMRLDPSGNVYVTGIASDLQDYLCWQTIKLDPSLNMVWMAVDSLLEEECEAYTLALDENGDVYVAGNRYGADELQVVKYTEADAGVTRIVLPADTFRIDARVTPQAWVHSYSSNTLYNIPVRMEIGGFYVASNNVASLAPHESAQVTFDQWVVRDAGTFVVRSWTQLGGDKDRLNDTSYSGVTVLPAWERLADMPAGSRGKDIKDGGALTFAADSLIYAFKGNNTQEFYRYNVHRDSWYEAETIPYNSRTARKRVKAGAQLAADTAGAVWALKGNNTFDLWRYRISGDSWREMAGFPPGPSGKKVKAGAGLCYVPSRNRLYAAKGANTPEFYSYDVGGDSWSKRGDVPLGVENKKVKAGSALAYDGDHTIYLLKGGSLGFWSYDIQTDTWRQRDNIRYTTVDPLAKRRKFKKGASIACHPGTNRVFATKGGKGREFWFFDVAQDSWFELPETDLFPMQSGGKAPYAGAAMALGKGKLYAFKGNRTREFYRYNADLPFQPGGTDGPQVVSAVPALRVQLAAAPNPFSARALLHYALPQSGRVRLTLYDVTGRVARTVVDGWQQVGGHAVPLTADGLAAGVYLARLQLVNDVLSIEATEKVLVAH
jgi:hypothetical protein